MKTIDPRKIKEKKKLLSDFPYVMLHKNFLNKNELNGIMKYAKKQKFMPSEITRGGHEEEDYFYGEDERSSKSIYLPDDHPITFMVTKKVCKIVDCKVNEIEKLQIVRYKPREEFKVHHDSYKDENGLHRDHTFFIYLNTIDNGSGCTQFPKLKMQVMPYAGSAIHWVNLKLNKKGKKREDNRLLHTGSKVEDTVKYGMNVWVRSKIQNYNRK